MMKSQNIADQLHRQPFTPFDIKTSDGRVYTVDHPDFLMRDRVGDVVFYVTDDNRPVTIALAHIVALEVTNSPRAA
jgi:hypothetical protein